MHDDELTWELHPKIWSIRLRSKATTPDAFGTRDYVLDRDLGLDPFAAGPLSTAVWRMGHLVSCFACRYEWKLGSRQVPPNELVDFTADTTMIDRLWNEIDHWTTEVDDLDDQRSHQIGYGQYPQGLGPQLSSSPSSDG